MPHGQKDNRIFYGESGLRASTRKKRWADRLSLNMRVVAMPASGGIRPSPTSDHGKPGFKSVLFWTSSSRVGRLVHVMTSDVPRADAEKAVIRRLLAGSIGSVSARYSERSG